MSDEMSEKTRLLERIELLESTLRNATNILRDGGYVYVKEIDRKFPEFAPKLHRIY